MSGTLETAAQLVARGWCVLPARPGGKRPAVTWKQYQDEAPNERELASMFARFPGGCNLWVATGAVSRLIVVDMDNRAAELWWRQYLGDDAIDTTCAWKTGRGIQVAWSIEPEQAIPGWSVHPDDPEQPSYDVRCLGGGVIVPPSVHQSGKIYEWIRDPEHLQPAPAALLAGPPGHDSLQDGPEGIEGPRSLLSKLLDSPPDGPDSGRNVWLTQVAGHLARREKHRDAFDAMLYTANRSLVSPLPDEEVAKCAESIWSSEQTKPAAGLEINADSGWLARVDGRILCPVKVEKSEPGLDEWADFDIECVGVITDDANQTAYWVRLATRTGRIIESELSGQVLGSWPELSRWLHGYECTIAPPPGDVHAKTALHTRLHRLLMSQDPPAYQAVEYLGWHDGEGFICHEGVITATGLGPRGAVVPHPRLRKWAPYRYGFVDQQVAKDVMREVLSFHDETVCAVFGSWCMAVLLKGHVMRQTSMFPIMAIEAPSESGKTSGMFALMMQLMGGTNAAQATKASLRDAISGNRSGVIWVDDISDTTQVEELIRHSTAEGQMTKKGQDRTSQETVRLVGAIVLSAESLGALHSEKALMDRSIMLPVPNPKDRRSLHDPERPQWDDIIALKDRWDNDLSQVAGTIVQMALARAHLVAELPKLRQGAGRFQDKMAIERVGARILADILDEPRIIELVDSWCVVQVDLGAENALTLNILPEFLAAAGSGLAKTPQGGQPVYVDRHGDVWFHEAALAIWWQREHRNDPRAQQLGNVHSIKEQRRSLGMVGAGIRKNTDGGGRGGQIRYQQLPADLSAVVLERAAMTAPGVMAAPDTDNEESLDFES